MATQISPEKALLATETPIEGQTDGVAVLRNNTTYSSAGSRAHDGVVALSNGDVGATLDKSKLCEVFEDFIGYCDPPKTGDTVVNHPGPWFFKDTSAAGSPTLAIVADADNGQYAMAFDSQNEAQVLTCYWKDEQCIDSDQEPVFVVRLKLDAQLTSGTKLVMGFASAQADDPDSLTQNAHILIVGGDLSLFLESDDNTTDTDDKDSGVDIAADTWYEFKISCSNYDGAAYNNVKFFYRSALGGDWTALTSSGVTFKMAADSAIQPFVQLSKTTGTATDGVKIDYLYSYWKRN